MSKALSTAGAGFVPFFLALSKATVAADRSANALSTWTNVASLLSATAFAVLIADS